MAPLAVVPLTVILISGSTLSSLEAATISPYSARSLLHSLLGWKHVWRNPSLIVAPMVVRSISGMKMITGSDVRSSSSIEAALGMLQTFRAYSITAICMPGLRELVGRLLYNHVFSAPKQIPKYGTLLRRAHFAASIMPSVPLWPKPPGTSIPSAVQISCQALWNSAGELAAVAGSRCDASTQIRSSLREQAIAACSSDFTTDK